MATAECQKQLDLQVREPRSSQKGARFWPQAGTRKGMQRDSPGGDKDAWAETGVSPKEQWSLSWPLSWAKGQGAQGGQGATGRCQGRVQFLPETGGGDPGSQARESLPHR